MHDSENPTSDRGIKIAFPGCLYPGLLLKSESGSHHLQKAPDDGRRYLTGVISGPRKDQDGERMSEGCLKSFLAQWEERGLDLLPEHLRPDVQSIGLASPDLGPSHKAYITETDIKDENGNMIAVAGDLIGTFRLWDEKDDPNLNIKEASVQWMKLTGNGPFRRRKKGLSIEGYIPNGAYKNTDSGPVIEDIDLVGVALTPWPSYAISTVSAHTKGRHPVCKALGWKKPETAAPETKDALDKYMVQDDFYDENLKIEYAFDDAERSIKNRAFPDDGSEQEPKEALLVEYAAAIDALKTRKLELLSRTYDSYAMSREQAAPEAVQENPTAQEAEKDMEIKQLKSLTESLAGIAALCGQAIAAISGEPEEEKPPEDTPTMETASAAGNPEEEKPPEEEDKTAAKSEAAKSAPVIKETAAPQTVAIDSAMIAGAVAAALADNPTIKGLTAQSEALKQFGEFSAPFFSEAKKEPEEKETKSRAPAADDRPSFATPVQQGAAPVQPEQQSNLVLRSADDGTFKTNMRELIAGARR